MTCTEVREQVPEYVLGTLDGAARATVAAHLLGCPACRAEAESVARATDALWALAPEAEPPAGFESRVLRAVAPRRSRRPARWAAALAAAAALVLTGFLARPLPSARPVAAGAMVDDRRAVVGHAAVSGGALPYVHVAVDGWGNDGEYVVEVVRADGSFVRVAPIRLVGGRGVAGAPLPVPYADVRAVWVTDAAHTEWCAFRVPSAA
jgi:anti-sigma factor RsiW